MNPLSFAPIVQYPAITCAVLLTLSNLFMTFAWYGHLKHLQGSPWWTAALSWFAYGWRRFRHAVPPAPA